MSEEIKSMPLPKTTGSGYVQQEFTEVRAAAKAAPSPKIASNYAVQEEVSDVSRTTPLVVSKSNISTPGAANVDVDLLSPNIFPQQMDEIKELSVSSADLSNDAKASLAEYYTLMNSLMTGNISVNDYYTQLPSLMSRIKDYVLNENDWMNLRNAILRTQNYIMKFLWTDMQNISSAMDEGFKRYQVELNEWIDRLNAYYTSDDFIPVDTIQVKHFSHQNNPSKDIYPIQQTIMNDMQSVCTRVGSTKPAVQYYNGTQNRIGDFPQNKSLIWIEVL